MVATAVSELHGLVAKLDELADDEVDRHDPFSFGPVERSLGVEGGEEFGFDDGFSCSSKSLLNYFVLIVTFLIRPVKALSPSL